MGYVTTLGYGGRETAGAGLLVKASRPGVGGVHPTYTYQYDAAGELTQEVDPTGG